MQQQKVLRTLSGALPRQTEPYQCRSITTLPEGSRSRCNIRYALYPIDINRLIAQLKVQKKALPTEPAGLFQTAGISESAFFRQFEGPDRASLVQVFDTLGHFTTPERYCTTPAGHNGDVLLTIHLPGNRRTDNA